MSLLARYFPSRYLDRHAILEMKKGGTFLKKLWCCVGGEYYKIIRFNEGLTLETSAFEFLYGGQFTSSTQLIKPNYLVILEMDHHAMSRDGL